MPHTIDLTNPVDLLSQLIRCPSVTPDTASAFDCLEPLLTRLGFLSERMHFSDNNTPDVENLFAQLDGPCDQPHLAFAGHVDVVPAGHPNLWQSPPFEPTLSEGRITGRGAVDMKGGIACFISAIARLKAENMPCPRISLIITGDEEGPAINGTVKLLEWMEKRHHIPDFCLVGEPTSQERVGDTIKTGRRGSLSFKLTVTGVQGHVAYPERATNPISVLAQLIDHLGGECDEGTEDFPPSHLEFVKLACDNNALNVIPHQAQASGNIRFNILWTAERLAAHLEKAARERVKDHKVQLDFEWLPCNSPAFLTPENDHIRRMSDAVQAVTGIKPETSTGGGTSDARFISRYCPVVELGDVGTTMHQINESTPIENLEILTNIYTEIIRRFVS